LITINSEDFQRAKCFPVRKEVVYVPGVGVETERFRELNENDIGIRKRKRQELGIHESDFVILCVAELNENKNIHQLIDAIDRLRKISHNESESQARSVKCVLAGDGEQRELLISKVQALELSEQICFLGFRTDIPELMAASDVVALLSKREGLPKALMEALAAEKPIVATDVRGNRDLVEDGVNGYLVQVGDVPGTAEAILKLLQDEQKRIQMGKTNRVKAHTYDISNILERMEKIYDKALSEVGRREQVDDSMKIVVTGGAGFIGSHVVEQLVKNNHQVAIIDDLSTGKEEYISAEAAFYKMSILEPGLDAVFRLERPEVVIHQAAQISVQQSLQDPVHDLRVNVEGTLRLLELSLRFGVRKFIFASTAAVYGNPQYLGIDEAHPTRPLSFYGLSKYASERYVRLYAELHQLRYTILRYANVYGIRQDPKGEGGVVSVFVDKLRKGKMPVIYGDGEQTRDFVYVEDVAKANLTALTCGDGEVINIGTGRPTSVNELLRLMNELNDTDIVPDYRPERPGDIRHSYLRNDKARSILGWEPEVTLREGLKRTLDYYRNYS